MYQKYYRQRKFGRLFSFTMVIGSGLAHYVTSGLGLIRNLVNIKTLNKYESFLPESLSTFVNEINKEKSEVESLFKSDMTIQNKQNLLTYKDNLKKGKENFDYRHIPITEFDAKNKETFHTYRKIKKILT